ncbi:heterokaryon incompatibility protein [Colletotrichum sojae]|uniref:Heterokaryon incompatibility protein n=1 Tax=Colletotrichum sojae TaxID=2175907 RepID=A0A8H6ISL1_9PEZI|nr:heterokaryon incompatibility protein [Colletotrichum sojae]
MAGTLVALRFEVSSPTPTSRLTARAELLHLFGGRTTRHLSIVLHALARWRQCGLKEDGVDAPLRGKVHVLSLSSSPDYEALSYVWGDPSDSTSIVVGEQKVEISRNLDVFLRKLRHSSQTRRLWADQICINQNDSIEKTAQVKLMGEIYSNCRHCLIWMGEIPESISLSAAQDVLHFLEFLNDIDNVPEPSFLLSGDKIKELLKALLLIHPHGNAWWQRIWTVQEVILPQNKTLFLGPLVLPWELLGMAIYHFLVNYDFREISDEDHRFMNVLCANVIWISNGRDFDVPAITATKWRYRGATNPRDKVFGLLGLVPDGVDMAFTNRCNYDSTEPEVFASFTLDSIVASEGLQPLHFNPRLEDDIATKDVPRWALDLKGSSRYEADPFHRDWAYGHYRACAGRPFNVSHLRGTVEANDGSTHALGVSGLRFEKIVEVSRRRRPVPYYDVTFANAESLLSDQLRAWHVLAAGHLSRIRADPGELREQFCRLVVGGLFETSGDESVHTPAPKDGDIDNIWRFVTAEEQDATKVWSSTQQIASQLCNQAFFLTESGTIGMGPWDTRVGDEVWVLDGGNYPFALRPRSQGEDCGEFDFLACCYVEGIMFGEIFQTRDEADIRKIRLL